MEDLERGYPQGMARYIRHTGYGGTPYDHVQQLIQSRAHHLAIETGRGSRPSVHLLIECPAYEHVRQTYQADLFSIFDTDVPVGEATRTDPALVKIFMDSNPAWKLARYLFECMEHRRESGRAVCHVV